MARREVREATTGEIVSVVSGQFFVSGTSDSLTMTVMMEGWPGDEYDGGRLRSCDSDFTSRFAAIRFVSSTVSSRSRFSAIDKRNRSCSTLWKRSSYSFPFSASA